MEKGEGAGADLLQRHIVIPEACPSHCRLGKEHIVIRFSHLRYVRPYHYLQ